MSDKFIYITDIHYAAYPANRKDNYNESILGKLEHVLKIAAKNNCTVLIGGDLFDVPKVKYIDMIAIMRLFKKYNTVTVFCIHGNEGHDGLVESSPLTFMKMSGLIMDNEGFVDYSHQCRIIFGGHGTDLKKANLLCHKDKYNILMTHTTLVQEPVIFDHILIEDFFTHADMVTIGHFHPEQGIIERQDHVRFVAPGSLSRRKKTRENVGRTPKMVYFSITDRKLDHIKMLTIPCGQNVWTEKSQLEVSEEIFYDSIRSEVVDMKSLIDTTDVVSLTLEETMRKYAESKNINPNVLEFVIKQIELTNA